MAKINAFTIQKGWIEVICGPMFAGKSQELIRRLSLLKFSNIKHLLFTPKIDTRTKNCAKARSGETFSSIAINKPIEILDYINNLNDSVQVIAIDEAQFFDESLADICNYLADNKYIVLVSGLDMDYNCQPFKSMMKLLTIAEKVIKLKAICVDCGCKASFSDRLNFKSDKQIVVGDKEIYSAKCRFCHSKKQKQHSNFPQIKKAK